jgi:hypothetical protein
MAFNSTSKTWGGYDLNGSNGQNDFSHNNIHQNRLHNTAFCFPGQRRIVSVSQSVN